MSIYQYQDSAFWWNNELRDYKSHYQEYELEYQQTRSADAKASLGVWARGYNYLTDKWEVRLVKDPSLPDKLSKQYNDPTPGW